MADRFFTDSAFVDDQITLADDQAHHLINVMRAKLGDEVVLFDGQGNEFQTRIIDLAKKRLTLQRLATTRPERKLATDITIAVSLPKGDRQKFLIEKLVELGVAKLIPLSTPRSVAQVNEKVVGRIEKANCRSHEAVSQKLLDGDYRGEDNFRSHRKLRCENFVLLYRSSLQRSAIGRHWWR